ncbi:uncharacterized protein BO80DRAFT_165114 [Aspergillus ibericus CBS 121593]|uniref:Uncharacterized protein n=1 Tax=Aspergillus ibericus CBS 121593 TaxID=1448316 RepID=A0A395GSA7_9EURO|nr:hypothetical protein BO80DRAFT_165114 [Aspergillus ibericus CBS 121593]RAK98262.1 hypothetical protein BO80DRAFT_165114 [Aspergillus ibericus CBS 121593]
MPRPNPNTNPGAISNGTLRSSTLKLACVQSPGVSLNLDHQPSPSLPLSHSSPLQQPPKLPLPLSINIPGDDLIDSPMSYKETHIPIDRVTAVN